MLNINRISHNAQEDVFENIYKQFCDLMKTYDVFNECHNFYDYDTFFNNHYFFLKNFLKNIKNDILNKIENINTLERMIDKYCIHKIKEEGMDFIYRNGIDITNFTLDNNGMIDSIHSSSRHNRAIFFTYIDEIRKEFKNILFPNLKKTIFNIIENNSEFEDIKERFRRGQQENTNNRRHRRRPFNNFNFHNNRIQQGNINNIVFNNILTNRQMRMVARNIMINFNILNGMRFNNFNAQISEGQHTDEQGWHTDKNNQKNVESGKIGLTTELCNTMMSNCDIDIPYCDKKNENNFFLVKNNEYFSIYISNNIERFASVLLKDVDHIFSAEMEMNKIKKNKYVGILDKTEIEKKLKMAKKKFEDDFNRFIELDKKTFTMVTNANDIFELEECTKEINKLPKTNLIKHNSKSDIEYLKKSINSDVNRYIVRAIENILKSNNSTYAKNAFNSIKQGRLIPFENTLSI